MEPRFKLLLVGGGHAMLPLLKNPEGISQNDVEITLVNDHQYVYYSGMIPEYLGDVYKQNEIRIDLKKLCEEAGIHFVQDIAIQLDPEKKYVRTHKNELLDYDLVVFDIGSRTPGDYDQMKSIPTKPLHNIENLKKYLNNDSKTRILTIIGGGSTGVEVALNVSSRYRKSIADRKLIIHMIESAESLLSTLPVKLSRYATNLLIERDVRIHLSTKPREIVENLITLSDGERIKSDFIFWATGSYGHTLFKEAGLPVNDNLFIKVNNHLQCITYPEIFAAGDCATIVKQPNLRKAGIHAVKQGPVLKENISRALLQMRESEAIKSNDLLSFKPYIVNPMIISTGQSEALWVSDGFWFHGSLMLRLKHYIDKHFVRNYLPDHSFGNSLFEMADIRNASMIVEQEK